MSVELSLRGGSHAVLRALTELLILLVGSLAVGWIIGTVQHFVAFGVWGDGFGVEAFEFACFEGGFVGIMFAVPTGIIVWYLVLHRTATGREVATVVLGSLLGGCLLGICFFWVSALLTPVLTIVLALLQRARTS